MLLLFMDVIIALPKLVPMNPRVVVVVDYFDNVMMTFTIGNRTDARKTAVNLFFLL